MRWECAECGEAVSTEHPPSVCPFCGTAGGRFVRAPEGIEGDPAWSSRAESWFHYGFEHPMAVAAVDAALAP